MQKRKMKYSYGKWNNCKLHAWNVVARSIIVYNSVGFENCSDYRLEFLVEKILVNLQRFWLKLYKIQKRVHLMAYKRFQNILLSAFSKIWRNIMIPFWSPSESNWIQKQKCWCLLGKRQKCPQPVIPSSQTWKKNGIQYTVVSEN